MLVTAFAALVLLFAVQALLVVKVADKLTEGTAAPQGGNAEVLQAGGRYAQAT